VVVGTITEVLKNIDCYYNACDYCRKKLTTSTVAKEKDDGSGELDFKKVYQCINPECNPNRLLLQ